jgi:hypothetical protein
VDQRLVRLFRRSVGYDDPTGERAHTLYGFARSHDPELVAWLAERDDLNDTLSELIAADDTAAVRAVWLCRTDVDLDTFTELTTGESRTSVLEPVLDGLSSRSRMARDGAEKLSTLIGPSRPLRWLITVMASSKVPDELRVAAANAAAAKTGRVGSERIDAFESTVRQRRDLRRIAARFADPVLACTALEHCRPGDLDGDTAASIWDRFIPGQVERAEQPGNLLRVLNIAEYLVPHLDDHDRVDDFAGEFRAHFPNSGVYDHVIERLVWCSVLTWRLRSDQPATVNSTLRKLVDERSELPLFTQLLAVAGANPHLDDDTLMWAIGAIGERSDALLRGRTLSVDVAIAAAFTLHNPELLQRCTDPEGAAIAYLASSYADRPDWRVHQLVEQLSSTNPDAADAYVRRLGLDELDELAQNAPNVAARLCDRLLDALADDRVGRLVSEISDGYAGTIGELESSVTMAFT